MDVSHDPTLLQTIVTRYETHGWVVQSVDLTRQRAFVRISGSGNEIAQTDLDDATVRGPRQFPACRKLWIDVSGLVQETDVPC